MQCGTPSLHKDARGLPLTLSSDAALEPYERALRALRTYRGDPTAPIEEALALALDFAAAHATKALIFLFFLSAALPTTRWPRWTRALPPAGRSGQPALAAHVANERLVQKPGSAWGHRIAERIANSSKPGAARTVRED